MSTSLDVYAEVASYEGQESRHTEASQYRDCEAESLHSPLMPVRRQKFLLDDRVVSGLNSGLVYRCLKSVIFHSIPPLGPETLPHARRSI